MRSLGLTTSEQLLNDRVWKKARAHRGWRNVSGLEAHPGQSLGQLHRVHAAVGGHVRLAADVHVHLADCGASREPRVRREPPCAGREPEGTAGGGGRGIAAERRLLIKLNVHP